MGNELPYRQKFECLLIKNWFVMQAIELGGFYDDEGYCNLTLAISRYSWKVKVHRLLEGSQKPTIQQIQQHLKEVYAAACWY